MVRFKQFLAETELHHGRAPWDRKTRKSLQDFLLFYAKPIQQPKPIAKPIFFRRIGGKKSIPSGFVFAFYIRLQGSAKELGAVSKKELPKGNGEVFVNSEVLVADFAFYLFQHLKNQGLFQKFAKGTLPKQHLNIADLKQLKFIQ